MMLILALIAIGSLPVLVEITGRIIERVDQQED